MIYPLRRLMNMFLPSRRFPSLMTSQGRTHLPDARGWLLTELMCQCLTTCRLPHLHQNYLPQYHNLLLREMLTHSDSK